VSGSDAAVVLARPVEEKFAWFLVCGFEVVVVGC
jgi:hypothetical protein